MTEARTEASETAGTSGSTAFAEASGMTSVSPPPGPQAAAESQADLWADAWADIGDGTDGDGDAFADDGQRTVVGALPFELRTRFTGRHQTVTALSDRVDGALRGAGGGFVVLVGEPGLGKSRMVSELVRRAKAAQPKLRALTGSADDATFAYAPIARALASRYGVTPSDAPESARTRITAGIAEVVPAARVVELSHLVAHILRVPFPDSPVIGPLADAPQRLEARIFMGLRRLLIAEAAHRPLILALEDLEKCGAETINLIHYLVAGLTSAPVMVIATATADLFTRHPTFGEGDVTVHRVDLTALPADDAEALVRALLAPLDAVPARVVTHARTLGGSPRAIHELVRLLLETEVIVRGPGVTWKVDDDALSRTTLPRTYDQLVAARLAAMPAAMRRVLEMAAAVGNTAWLDAMVAIDRTQASAIRDPDGPTLSQIAATQDQSRNDVLGAVAQLVEREWLVEAGRTSLPGERELRFAYPHLWTLVYGSIEDGRRRSYHATVARWLELRGRDEGSSGPSAPDAIARHLELAGEARAAAARFRQAAEAARAQYRNEHAIRLFDRALACIGDADIAARVALWHDLGSVYELVGDFEAALGAFERMLRLSWLAASKSKAAVAFNKMGRVWRRKGDLALALEYLERGLELFQTADDARGVAGSLDDIGKTLHLLGRTDEAYQKVTDALARRGAGGDPRSIAASLSNLGVIQHDRGQFDAAAVCHREALTLRQAAGDRIGVVGSQNNLAVLAFELGDLAGARAQWTAGLTEAEALGALPLCAMLLTNLGELALRDGKLEEARSRLDDALEIIEDIEDRHLESESCRLLAELECRAGKLPAARRLAERALATASKVGLRDREALAHLTLATIASANLYDAGDDELGTPAPSQTVAGFAPGAGQHSDAASRHFGIAEQILRTLDNRLELAKALEAYGRYLLERDRGVEARRPLTEARALFADLGLAAKVTTVDGLLATAR